MQLKPGMPVESMLALTLPPVFCGPLQQRAAGGGVGADRVRRVHRQDQTCWCDTYLVPDFVFVASPLEVSDMLSLSMVVCSCCTLRAESGAGAAAPLFRKLLKSIAAISRAR